MDTEALNVKPLYLNEPKMAADFLSEKLGFVIYEHTLICDRFGGIYEIFHKVFENADTPVINIGDCLLSYYDISRNGLNIINKPHYVPEGLAFEISDPWRNNYILLEKRKYND